MCYPNCMSDALLPFRCLPHTLHTSHASHQVRTVSITLNGLLDYDRDDAEEVTVELSLFAEQFHEMLAREFGFNIYQALLRER